VKSACWSLKYRGHKDGRNRKIRCSRPHHYASKVIMTIQGRARVRGHLAVQFHATLEGNPVGIGELSMAKACFGVFKL